MPEIELPPKRIVGEFACPDCSYESFVLTRYKVGSVDPTEDDVVNGAHPEGACPDCGGESEWELQSEPVEATDEQLDAVRNTDQTIGDVFEEFDDD